LFAQLNIQHINYPHPNFVATYEKWALYFLVLVEEILSTPFCV